MSGFLDEDPWQLIVPAKVYHELGKRGVCCGCFPNVVDIILRVVENYHLQNGLDEAASRDMRGRLDSMRQRQRRVLREGRSAGHRQAQRGAVPGTRRGQPVLGCTSGCWKDWGLTLLAKKERAESIEEMHHADRLIERIIFLEGHPNAQRVAPLRIGQRTCARCSRRTLPASMRRKKPIPRSRELCASLRDYVSKELFDELLKDEESHINFLEAQIRLLETIGPERYAQLNAAPASEQA